MSSKFEPKVEWDPGVEAYLEQAFPGKFQAMQTALTRPPSHTCMRVNTLKINVEVTQQLLPQCACIVYKLTFAHYVSSVGLPISLR